MKIQSFAVIFAIIILPVIIILSYYIHREIDTIALQNSYDTKLIDATHDAMAAFELNTANEDLSSVADELRSIIEASNNTFFNSLATNLGMSNANKSYVQSYVPAILYTLYDGYYIYSPTRVPEVLTSDNGEVIYVGDPGVEAKTSFTENGKKIGRYSYNKNKNTTVSYNSLASSIKYEYGQMLYKNDDGTYSVVLNSHTVYKQDYILKSYMPYSARYIGSKNSQNYDITINYTLDNYLTIMGTIGNVYYSKTGYFIGKNVVEIANAQDITDTNLLNYNENEAEKICLSGIHKLNLRINPYLEDGKTRAGAIEYSYNPYIENGEVLSYSDQEKKLKKCYEKIENDYDEYRKTDGTSIIGKDRKNQLLEMIRQTNEEVQNLELSLETLRTINYYVKAQIFSNWVYNNLGTDGLMIEEQNLSDDLHINNDDYTTELSGTFPAFYHSFEGSHKIIFDSSINPEYEESNFEAHKYEVIKNSIQYNLNLALSSYDKMIGTMNIRMPVILESEWDKILRNVSIVSFMQGFNCGLKYYNNYAIISSTNNELTVIPNEIYYVAKDEYNTGDLANYNPLYHRIDCDLLVDSEDLISFKSKEIKYDRIYDKNLGNYKYDHKNFACYNCIVSSNYEKDVLNSTGNKVRGYSNKVFISTLPAKKRKSYYRAIANAREITYKTNALSDSSGYEVLQLKVENLNFSEEIDSFQIIKFNKSTRTVNEMKAIQITFGSIKTQSDATTAIFKSNISDENLYLNLPAIKNIASTLAQTITIPVHKEDLSKLQEFTLEKKSEGDVEAKILNVKVIYE